MDEDNVHLAIWVFGVVCVASIIALSHFFSNEQTIACIKHAKHLDSVVVERICGDRI